MSDWREHDDLAEYHDMVEVFVCPGCGRRLGWSMHDNFHLRRFDVHRIERPDGTVWYLCWKCRNQDADAE